MSRVGSVANDVRVARTDRVFEIGEIEAWVIIGVVVGGDHHHDARSGKRFFFVAGSGGKSFFLFISSFFRRGRQRRMNVVGCWVGWMGLGWKMNVKVASW